MDCTISAEIPDPKTHQRLYDAVMKHMIHELCGKENRSSPCMEHMHAWSIYGANCTRNSVTKQNLMMGIQTIKDEILVNSH